MPINYNFIYKYGVQIFILEINNDQPKKHQRLINSSIHKETISTLTVQDNYPIN